VEKYLLVTITSLLVLWIRNHVVSHSQCGDRTRCTWPHAALPCGAAVMERVVTYDLQSAAPTREDPTGLWGRRGVHQPRGAFVSHGSGNMNWITCDQHLDRRLCCSHHALQVPLKAVVHDNGWGWLHLFQLHTLLCREALTSSMKAAELVFKQRRSRTPPPAANELLTTVSIDVESLLRWLSAQQQDFMGKQ